MSVETVALLKQIVMMLFFAIFTIVVVWAVRMPRAEVETLSRLPLASDDRPLQGGERNG